MIDLSVYIKIKALKISLTSTSISFVGTPFLFSTPLLYLFEMLLYEDIISGDEMFSDAFPMYALSSESWRSNTDVF